MTPIVNLISLHSKQWVVKCISFVYAVMIQNDNIKWIYEYYFGQFSQLWIHLDPVQDKAATENECINKCGVVFNLCSRKS